jgi:hypothetical protein
MRITVIYGLIAIHIEQNITKARRTAYSLLSAGFHGVNGLDPMTSLSLYKTYIQPVLTYGLEIVQLKQSNSFCIIYFNNHTFLWLEFISMSITVTYGLFDMNL